LAGCSSQTTSLDEFDLFFRFRANGALVEFTTVGNVYGVFVEAGCGEAHSLQITAWEPWDLGSRLGLHLGSMSAFRPMGFGVGSYSVDQRTDDPSFRIRLYYRTPEGIDYFAEPVVPSDATLEIYRVGASTVDGAFFGVLKAEGQPDVVITDGEFSVRREHDYKPPCR
jgi:hypothetical protein